MSTPAFHIIIPARLNSSRLPRKLLLEVNEKPIIEHVYRQCEKVGAASVTIATDSHEIFAKAQEFGADVVITGEHASGTDRIAEAARILGLSKDAIIVNVQGDEPQMRADLILQVVRLIESHQSCWASLCWPIDTLDDFLNPNIVKVVVNNQNQALYFSRSPIPFYRDKPNQVPKALRHIGLYAYRMQSLQEWVQAPMSLLEQYECLEQLRALSLGMSIQMEEAISAPGQDINTLEDFEKFKSVCS